MPLLPPHPLAGRFANLGRALRHRNYRLFFAGQLISLIGTWMQVVAQSWLVYRLTDSAQMLGLMGFASQGPVFLLSILGGVVADRYSRHRIMLVTQATAMVLAVILAVLTLSETIAVWELFVLAALLGVSNAFDIPARQSFVVEMVGHEDLPNAIALNSSLFNGARLFGPAIAGALVAAGGEGWCFVVNAVSFLAVIAGLLAMRLNPRPQRAADGSVLAYLRDGIRFVAGHRPIRTLMLLLGNSSLMGMSYVVLMPIFADRILQGGATALGTLMGASGLGAFGAAVLLASRSNPTGLAPWVARGAIAFGAGLILFALSHWFWLSALVLVGVGFSFMVQMAATNTLIQVMIPDQYRGRAMALFSMMFIGLAPFGALLAGALAERIGAPLTVMAGGGLSAVAGLAVWGRPGLLRRGGTATAADS